MTVKVKIKLSDRELRLGTDLTHPDAYFTQVEHKSYKF